MAEPAVGAVNLLLGVIRNEAQLLGGVRADVQFIKEEMQSMKSFLAHLSRTAPPGEHDEQVRTWMDQVRHLALDCSGCIDLYLYRGNREIHRARGGLSRYFFWLPWYLKKMVAQHHAAIQLRELKDRARDVGERRCRYGVELPANVVAGRWSATVAAGLIAAATTPPSSSAHAAAAGVEASEDDDEDGDELVVARATKNSGRSRSEAFLFEACTMENYFRRKLQGWMKSVSQGSIAGAKRLIPSIAVVANDEETLAFIAHEAEAMAADPDHFIRSVLVDIPALHMYDATTPLQTRDILYYILWGLKHRPKVANTQSSQERERIADHQSVGEELDVNKTKVAISWGKKKLIDEITEKMVDVYHKISEIISRLEAIKSGHLGISWIQITNDALVDLPQGHSSILYLPLWLLKLEKAGNSPVMGGNGRKKEWYKDITKKTAKMLKEHMEIPSKKEHTEKEGQKPICLDETQYEQILEEVFPLTRKPIETPEQATMTTSTTISTTTSMGEDQIKGLIHKILRELQEDKSVKKQEAAHDKPDQKNQSSDSHIIDATMQKIRRIGDEVKEQLLIRGMVDKIKDHLKHDDDDERIMVILKLDHDYLVTSEKSMNALSLLGSVAGVLMLTTASSNTRLVKEYCYPPSSLEHIDYSLVGLYRDIALELTRHRMNEDNSQVITDILGKCEPYEFCMKMFTHALYTNPNRKNKELKKLHSTLQLSPKSFDSISKKIFKFSYSDLPEEYKSCLLYLAIFPQEHSIRRSTLIGRWVAEGLITREDWPTSVHQAEQCFHTLINRWLVYPYNISAAGQVKSCVVGGLVHGFITKVARKQRIVQTRLSHHLARHFSIFNDLGLRSSDGIDKFFQRLSESSRVSLIKVLDLETCYNFGVKYQYYLKDICNKMLLLKYLSLRGTNITHLPTEINNLHELEVLDIRETQVPEVATVNLLLLKLKRLLAGHICPSPSSSNTGIVFGHSVQVPDKIEKMVNVEVLSNVKARNRQDLKDIGKLWQLRKLGVVIIDKDSHLRNLLRTISDLHECIRSLSITLSVVGQEGTPSSRELPDSVVNPLMKNPPKLLESLSISGTTQRMHLLGLLSTHGDSNKLAKVTLCRTLLNKENLEVLAKLPELQCVRFQHIECTESVLIFKKDEFKHLKYLLVEGSNLGGIIFENDGDTRELKKMVLSSTNIAYIRGVDGQLKLEELELKNNFYGKLISSFDDDAQKIAKLTLRGTLLEQVDLQILAEKPNIRYLILLERSCGLSQITFNKDEFPKLNLLNIDCPTITKIIFADGSVPKLEKIVWSSFTSLLGIEKLPRLKELEFQGDCVPDELKEAIRKGKNEPRLKHIKPELHDPAGEQEDGDDDTKFSFWSKIKI